MRSSEIEQAEVDDAVNKAADLLGGMETLLSDCEKTGWLVMKPNLLAKTTPDKACTTHPAVFKAVGKSLQKAGYKNLKYGDSPGMPMIKVEKVAEECGIKESADELILKGRKIHEDVRAIIIPATQQIYKDCIKQGYLDIFIDAGCVVSTPTCGPCLGGHMGILAAGERCVATTNRNFVGRMGHVKSEVYLASPAVAAASAVTGRISGPDDIK